MAGIEETIAALEARLKQARAQRQREEARKRAAVSKRTRAADTRRKILVGAVVLSRVAHGELLQSQLHEWMDQALTRDDDRALFGLAVKEVMPEPKAQEE